MCDNSLDFIAPSPTAARLAGLHLFVTNAPSPSDPSPGFAGRLFREETRTPESELRGEEVGEASRSPTRPRPRRTYSGSRAGCAVGRGLGTRLRAAARPRAAPAAPHRPPPAEGPPSPPSSPELLRRGWRSLHFRLARGVPGKCPRRPPHNLFSGFLPGARSQPVNPSGHAQDTPPSRYGSA